LCESLVGERIGGGQRKTFTSTNLLTLLGLY